MRNEIDPAEFTNWALSATAINWLMQFIQANNIESVLECGSGLSTIAFGVLLRDGKIKRVRSLEHHQEWFEHTDYLLEEKGLSEFSDLQYCPLKQQAVNGKLARWFDIKHLESFKADLILVDSPPSKSDLWAREPAPYLLKDYLKPGTWILLDDYDRPAEQQIVQMWISELKLELTQIVRTDKGLAVLRNKNDRCVGNDR